MRKVVNINFKNINSQKKIPLIYNQSYLNLVEWISSKSVATGTAVPTKPVVLLNASITGTPLKPVDLLISSAMHAAGHCAPHSASTVLLETEEKPWKTSPKASSTAFSHVPSIASDAVTEFTTASR